MKQSNKIAVQIQSEVQLFSLEVLLRDMLKKYSFVDVIVDDYDGNQLGYSEIARSAKKLLSRENFEYKEINNIQNCFYDVALLPYMDKRIKSKYYLKYEYGTLNIKPSLTYLPHLLEGFHGFLCQSVVTHEILKAYGATFPVDNLRFCKKGDIILGNNGKKRLLFAPTYNDQDEAQELLEIMKLLKEKYYLVVKGHHGTSYLKENLDKREVLSELADEYYDSSTNISNLISKVDVCLFGNSSAIGEALYAKVPCVIYAKDLDYFGLDGIHTTQYRLVEEGVLPWASRDDEIIPAIKKAMSAKYKNKQGELSDKLFPKEYKTGVDGYLQVIDFFLKDPLAQDYALLHDFILMQREKKDKKLGKELRCEREKNQVLETDNKSLMGKIEKLENENIVMGKKMKDMNKVIENMNKIMEDNKKKKLYKISDKLYKIEGRILRVKS